ncbi:ABC transporter permease subunit [Olsenella uli]|uniref:ABC transporter permease subunit n=1 Tax=Olsenella uli TaxID=133926 RepID=UPI00315CF390
MSALFLARAPPPPHVSSVIYLTVKGSDVFVSVLAFTIFTSAVVAEIVRGGFNSISRSQFEAAQSQGFGFFSTMRHVILPQTFRTIVPALFSQCTTVIKDSSYLAGINVAELMFSAKVVMGYTTSLSQVLLLYGLVFLMYFALKFGISLLVRAYQRRLVAA